MALVIGFGHPAVEIFVGQELPFKQRRQLVYPPKTSVVAGVIVFRARVAKAYKQFNHVRIILLVNSRHKKARLERASHQGFGCLDYFLPLPLAGAAAAAAGSGAASSTTVTTLTTTGLFLP